MQNTVKKYFKSYMAGHKAALKSRHQNLKFAYVSEGQSQDPVQQFVLPVKNLVLQMKFEEAVDFIIKYQSQSIYNRMGRPLASIAACELNHQFEGKISHQASNLTLLPHYEAWFARQPDCPFAAATYADVLGTTGYSFRGTGWAKDVSQEGWDKLKHYGDKADLVFNASQTQFSDHWYWASSFLRQARVTCEDKAVQLQRFHKAFLASPLDTSVFESITYSLLPRWFGSYEDVDQNARWIVDQTHSQMGYMAYAFIYHSYTKFEDLKDGTLNWDMINHGFRDWYARFPNDKVKTAHASLAYEWGDYETCLPLLESLEEFHEDVWTADESVHMANSICLEFTTPST